MSTRASSPGPSTFGRRGAGVPPDVIERTRGDVGRFLVAFAGGFVFFSILIL